MRVVGVEGRELAGVQLDETEVLRRHAERLFIDAAEAVRSAEGYDAAPALIAAAIVQEGRVEQRARDAAGQRGSQRHTAESQALPRTRHGCLPPRDDRRLLDQLRQEDAHEEQHDHRDRYQRLRDRVYRWRDDG